MKKRLRLLSLLLTLGAFSTAFGQVSKSNTTNVTVNGSTGTHVINFTAGDMGGCTSLTDVNVTLDWTGGAFQVVEQVAVSITSPAGTVVHLSYDTQGVLTGDNTQLPTFDQPAFATWGAVSTTFDDEGSAIPNSSVPATGAFIPEEPLSAFDGENPVGNWTITYSDGVDNTFGDDYTVTTGTIEIACGAACTDPDVPTVTFTPATVCDGNNATLNIAGNLNDATAWHVYTGSCGGTSVGSTAGTSMVVTPSSPSTTYFVRGEGGCVTPGSCGSTTITVTANDDASFSYSAASYCVDDSDPTPTITGTPGGSFSSTAGLLITPSTGAIDVSASTPGTYTVTYTTAGACPANSNVSVTINPLDDASFNYSAAAYCVDDSDPTPTITGLGGGGFTSTPLGLNINPTTGLIDVSLSTPGAYTVTYTTTGTCPNSSNVAVTINGLDDASFNYSAASYCVNDSDPTPTITGLGGGGFTSSPLGLNINPTTGLIDVSLSTPGTYTVTYTTTGACPNSSNVAVTVNGLDDPSFSYSAASYCVSDSDPTPTITGLGGGGFTSAPLGLNINPTTGLIDVSLSTPGTYTVTYTTTGTCPSSSNVAVTINGLDDASFNYSAASYCVNDSDPTPTITGLGGGGFTSSPLGLNINPTTGLIDVSLSTPGTYTVTYTTTGACPNSSNVAVTVNALDDPSFSYSAAAYCGNDSDPTPTITGLPGGTFSSTAGLSITPSTGAIDVSASTPGTYTVTYTTAGACPSSSNVSVTINASDDASFNYSAASYCVNDSDPTPTVTGLTGGTFSSTPGLSIASSTGAIDVSASTPGTYTVTYTTAGSCPNTSNVAVTVNGLDDASFSYSAVAYCLNDSDPTPTITGLPGGTFSSTPGLSITPSTGAIDVSASTPGTYTVTYTTAGSCPNSSNVAVTVNGLDDASFNYSAAAYCVSDADPTPTVTGLPGGTFSSTPGLSITPSTGAIDVSASTPGTYTVTYTTVGTCPNSSNVSVTVNGLDDASFSYSAAGYCVGDSDPTPTITGLPGGTFSSTPGLSITPSTGAIDISASTPGTYTVTYTTTGTCPNGSNVSVTISTLPTVTYTAPADLCIDAGVQTGLGSGSPTGGVYSGAGVTDDGNGMTYSFDPAAAGAGSHTITYTYTNGGGCTASANDAVEVFALPTVTFTALADLCIDAGVQTGLGSGAPTGGVYSGTGVTDDGNGTTYSFDPAAAGVGVHTITYTYTNANGCTASANDNVEVFALPTVTFTALADICVDAGVQTGLGSGAPTGGVYSGTGVTDDGNGMTYSFDPAAAGVGVHTITYTYTNANGCTASANDDVEVFALPTVTFTAPADLCVDAGVQAGLGSGSPTGGVYSGTGVTDDGNGTTYSFDPAAAGVGVHTITYTYTNANGCTASANDDVEVFALPTVTFTALADLCVNAGVQSGLGSGTPTGGVYSGTGVTDDGNGTTYSFDPAAAGVGVHTITYTFTNANGCISSANDVVEVLALPAVSFTAPADLCIDAGVQTGLGSGTPTGGVYSGAGVTDDGNGTTYSFDPAAAGAGIHTITYTFTGANGCNGTASDQIEVFALPAITFTSPGDFCIADGVQTGLGSASPTGGVYSGTGITDDGNGTTYSFDPATAGMGAHTVTYTYTNANGCTSSEDIVINVTNCAGYECANALTFAALDPCGATQTVTGSTVGGTPNAEPFCGTSVGTGGATWYTFTGDGSDVVVSTANPGTNFDTKLWVYEGACGALNCVDGNDDASGSQSEVSFNAAAGLTYYVVVGGFSANEGDYELTLTNTELVAPVPDVATLADVTGVCEITSLTDPTATDNCSAVTVTNDVTLPITANTTITWTYEDASGNQTTQTQNVVLTDNIAPTASNPDTLTVECIADAVIDVTVVDDAMDNCAAVPTVTWVSDTVIGNGCYDTIVRVYNVADASANSIDVTQIILVHDVTAPTASNPITLTVQCTADIPAPNTSWVSDEADNCATPSVTWVGDVSDGQSCPETITRTFLVADNCGNSITVEQLVVVNDIEGPIANDTTLATVTGFCDITPTAPTATDNCSGVVTGVADVTFPINTLGSTIVTWTYTDDCGNTTTQTQEVIIESIEVGTWIANDNITIVATNIEPGVTYQWIDCSDNNAPLAGETNHNFTPTYSSDFAVIVTQDGCSDTSACVTVTDVSLDDLSIAEFNVYPNPSTGVFTVAFDGTLKAIEVIDVLGRQVNVNVELTSGKVDASSAEPGKYFVRVITDAGQVYMKEILINQ